MSFVKKQRKKPLGICKHRWENNIKMNLMEIERSGMEWIDLAQDREQ
jgi:hypothetical protein